MQSTIKDQAQELIRINLNQLLKVQVIPSGDEVMEKNRLDFRLFGKPNVNPKKVIIVIKIESK